MSNCVGVLGPIEITADDRSTVDTGGKRQRRLLAALAVRAGDVVSVDSLVDIVFEGNPTESAERTLQSYVSRLRRAVDGENHSNGTAIERTSPGYVLRLETDSFDAFCFVDGVQAARDHAANGDHAAAVRGFDDALRLSRGRPFAEFADEPWALAESERLSEIRATAIEDRAESQLALGGHAEVIPDLERFSREETTRERPRAQLMLALYRSGRQAEALRVYQDYSRYLGEEMGLEPSATLRDLESKIIASDPSLEVEPLGGEQLRGYHLYEELGRGAFSVVHRGTQPSVGRDVAVKVIRAELANDSDFVRRFETEAHMVANLEHPHIVPLYDFWREPDNAYLVMRWLRGGTLRDQVTRCRLSLDETARLVQQVGGALEAAHRRGIVHRDIKPANVFCDADGNYYLGDFGIAIGSIADDEFLAPLTIAPAYASPELLERRAIGPAADIYSLGATAFEALTGAAPFADATSDAELVERQCHEPLPLISSIRSGVPISIDQVIQRATAKSAIGRYASAADLVDAFGAAVAEATGSTVRSVSPAPSAVPGPNPYKGLRAFQEADAADFFGRSALTAELVQVLSRDDHEGRLLTVVGPSGSGKSSVVRAGLIPALRDGALPGSEDWFVATVLPGSSPFAELEAALLRIAVNPPGTLMEQLRSGPDGISRAVKRVLPDDLSELVVVIDQFEELFTLVVEADEREAFLEALVHAVDDPRARVRVVATLRADFYDRPLRDPVVADAIKLSTVAITPLASEELAKAIARPAQRAGGSFEDGLVARIAADVADQPGSLPLLQYSLAELYEQTGGHLTHDGYETLGGVTGALAGRAETIYRELDGAGRQGARRLFTRLVTLGEDGDDTRRRIPLHELGSDPAISTPLGAYGSSRLLAFDRDAETREPTVEISHEALIGEWPRFRSWIDDDRDGLRIHRHLTTTATAWQNRGEDEADLYRGSRLETASTWAGTHPEELNEIERRFIDASTTRSEQEAARAVRQSRRLRRSLVGVAFVAVVAMVAGAIAVNEQRQADDARAAAEAERDAAESAQVAEASALDEARAAQVAVDIQLREARIARLRDAAAAAADPSLALLLGLEANRMDPGNSVALDALAHGFLGTEGWLGSINAEHLVVADGIDAVVTIDSQGVQIRPLHDPLVVERSIPMTDVTPDTATAPAVAPDGRRLALGTSDGLVIVDLETGRMGDPVESSDPHANYRAITWTNDSRLLVNDVPVGVYDVANVEARLVARIPLPGVEPSDNPGALLVADPDRSRLAVYRGDASLEIWDTDQLADPDPLVATIPFPEGTGVIVPYWGDNGRLLVTSILSTGDAGSFWTTAGRDSYALSAVETELGTVWNARELSDGSIFVSSPGQWAIVNAEGQTIEGPWAGPEGKSLGMVELDADRLVISAIDITTLEPGPIDIRSRSGGNPLSRHLSGFGVPGDTVVQYLPKSQLATVSAPVSDAVLHGTFQVGEVWDLRGDSPRRVEFEGEAEFDRLRLSETTTGPVVAALRDPNQLGDHRGCDHCVTGGLATVFDALTGQVVGEAEIPHGEAVYGLYVSSDRSELTALSAGPLRVFDLESGEMRQSSFETAHPPTWIVRDEELGLGYASGGGRLTIYGLETLAVVHEHDLPGDSRVLSGADGQLAVVGGNPLHLVDLETGSSLGAFPNPGSLAGRLDDSGDFIIGWGSTQRDGVQLWDVDSRRPLGPKVPGPVGDLHTGSAVAQVRNGAVHVWETHPREWVGRACIAAGRNLSRSEWAAYLPDDRPYEATCPQYPLGEGAD